MQIIVQYLAFNYNLVFAFTGESHLAAGTSFEDFAESDLLEFIFRQCNHVDDSEWISTNATAKAMRLRSMSVGDVVLLVRDGAVKRFRCEPCGWAEMENVR